jgi:dCTP deaminase
MILTGPEIRRQIELGNIVIDPFDLSRINPNSYNLSLHEDLYVYKLGPDGVLDMKQKTEIEKVTIPEGGLVLQPGTLYLGRTVERTETHNLVPMLEGRSSIGRLGLFIHVTAGFGDVGFNGFWTLEISAIHPVRIYAGIEICQIFYHQVEGKIVEYSSGKYQNNTGVQGSKIYREFGKVNPSDVETLS